MTTPTPPPARSCCLPATGLSISPSALSADTPGRRRVDRVLPRSGASVVLYFAAVIRLLVLATALPPRWGLAMDALASLTGGTWCAINFWRCRQAHCLVTGLGWLALGGLSLAEVGIDRSLIGRYEEGAFYGILAAGILFECLWVKTHGTHALGATNLDAHPSCGG